MTDIDRTSAVVGGNEGFIITTKPNNTEYEYHFPIVSKSDKTVRLSARYVEEPNQNRKRTPDAETTPAVVEAVESKGYDIVEA